MTSIRFVSPSPHCRPQASADAHESDAGREGRSPTVRVTIIVANRYTFDTELMSGRQIKERASIPAGFDLHRRRPGGNESIRDDDTVELRDGDHLFARGWVSPGARP